MCDNHDNVIIVQREIDPCGTDEIIQWCKKCGTLTYSLETDGRFRRVTTRLHPKEMKG